MGADWWGLLCLQSGCCCFYAYSGCWREQRDEKVTQIRSFHHLHLSLSLSICQLKQTIFLVRQKLRLYQNWDGFCISYQQLPIHLRFKCQNILSNQLFRQASASSSTLLADVQIYKICKWKILLCEQTGAQLSFMFHHNQILV